VKASCIIPCRNEESNLCITIGLLKQFFPYPGALQVIVVDHGSEDQSVTVAREAGAEVVESPGVPLGRLRNEGARIALGDVLFFLDADISVTAEWGLGIMNAMERAVRRPMYLTGAFALPPEDSNWIAKAWDQGLPRAGAVRRLSGGHMVMSAVTFNSVGGFPERLDSGEDEGLSERIWEMGGKVELDPQLLVYHRGVAGTARSFFRRQYWHGVGDWRSQAGGGLSKTAWLAIAFGSVHVGVASAFVMGHVTIALLFSALLAASLVYLGRRRCKRCAFHAAISVALLFYIYMWARLCATVVAAVRGNRPGGRQSRG